MHKFLVHGPINRVQILLRGLNLGQIACCSVRWNSLISNRDLSICFPSC